MRLKYIEQCSFRYSEETNMRRVLKERKLTLNKGDVVALISSTGKQLLFVYAFSEIVRDEDGELTTPVLASRRYRITGAGTWNPLMLKNYAEEVGIELVGIKRFEEYYKSLRT